MIDLRSDTVTQPTEAMRRAMAAAEVGDDVYGEDPTVNRLEELAAERFGKEAALLVASGTMGNLVALLSHCGRGNEAIVGARTHISHYEQGGMAALGGIHQHPVADLPFGRPEISDIEQAINSDDDHLARTTLVCLETTHNEAGGRVLPLAYLEEVARLAAKNHLRVHIDGARVFNAAVALNVPVSMIAHHADSVMFCLSKGLACPVGSLLVGSRDFIGQARRNRKLVGGGMRQAGVLAAAGLVALNEMVDRLVDDHANARRLAEGLADMDGVEVDPGVVETNIFYITITKPGVDAEGLAAQLSDQGVRISTSNFPRVRLVLHYEVGRAEVDEALRAFQLALA
ncbi:MAG: low-specificity L-threonine aldolase [Chloroflexi bacterium]|nr:low-specificity L-threonine aldolase [Chloroflexota bacterium]